MQPNLRWAVNPESGTRLGHNLPDSKDNRYCINLFSVAGHPEAATDSPQSAAAEFLDLLLAMHPVIMFSKTYCSYCKQAKKLLREAGANVRWEGGFKLQVLELDTHPMGQELQQLLALRTVPSVFIGGEHVGGCDAVKAMGSGLLKQQLEVAQAALKHTHKHVHSRHPVAASSDAEEPAPNAGNTETAVFAAGCFWGVELFFQRIPGVESTRVGYIGGTLHKPSYNQVCSGSTGHAEAVEIVYNPGTVTYAELVQKLFERHDPTTLNRQGNDSGTHYRSCIFYHGKEQQQRAEEAMKKLQNALQDGAAKKIYGRSFAGKNITTELSSVDEHKFFAAEDYHQQYLEKGGQDASKNSTENIRCYG